MLDCLGQFDCWGGAGRCKRAFRLVHGHGGLESAGAATGCIGLFFNRWKLDLSPILVILSRKGSEWLFEWLSQWFIAEEQTECWGLKGRDDFRIPWKGQASVEAACPGLWTIMLINNPSFSFFFFWGQTSIRVLCIYSRIMSQDWEAYRGFRVMND